MELVRRTDGLVSPLAIVRAIRGETHAGLARAIGVAPETLFSWERGETNIPTGAMAKRLGLALGWRWQDLLGEPKPHDEAWRTLVEARQRIAASR